MMFEPDYAEWAEMNMQEAYYEALDRGFVGTFDEFKALEKAVPVPVLPFNDEIPF